MRKKRLAIGLIGILGLIALLLILVFFNPYKLNSTLKFTSQHLIIGSLFLILLRTLSSILPIIPGGAIAFATVPILGWLIAFICNTLGIVFGSSIAFFLARFYREPLVERFATLNKIHELEKKLTSKKQFLALLAFKLFTVPVVDISSYVVGLTKINYFKFLAAAFIAALPTAFIFYFGSEVFKRIFGKNLFLGVATILIIVSIYFIIKRHKVRLKI